MTGARPGRAAEVTARLVFWVLAGGGLFYLFLKYHQLAEGDLTVPARNIDFLVFWSAAKLSLAGQAVDAFDQALLAAAGGVPEGTNANMPWYYPPGYMMAVTPFGLMPFWLGWSVFSILSAIALGFAARGPAAPLPGGWRLVVVAPVVLIGCLAIGQISALWTAGLIAALWALQRNRPAPAGIWIGLLTLKPQLGLLIPVALLAGREWRVIAWATGAALAIAAVSTAVFGMEYWRAFLDGLSEATEKLGDGSVLTQKHLSAYAFFRAVGIPHDPALWAQIPVSLAAAAAVAWVWSRKAVSPDLKAATLCAAIPLAAHYVFYYEMVVTLAAALFLARDGFGRGWLAKLWLLVIWVGPVVPLYLPQAASIAGTMPPAIAATLVICLVRAARAAPRPAPT